MYFKNLFHNGSKFLVASFPTLKVYCQTCKFQSTMPPVEPGCTRDWLQKTINNSPFVIFSKTTCPFCQKIKKTLKEQKFRFAAIEIDKKGNTQEIQDCLQSISGSRTVPQVYVRGEFIGGHDDTVKALGTGKVSEIYEKRKYDYDLVVIGGGSGGLAASKEASRLGAKVACLDYVVPTPKGTSWGLGGTCVNVGCIPKKLMHQAAILSHNIEDASKFGWEVEEKNTHNWDKMVENVQNHIGSLNWGYRVALRDNAVDYKNAYGEMVDEHTIKCTDKRGKETNITTNHVIIATGERPRYPGIAGDKEFCITSDDLFSLSYNPGKTLVVGASYVALECAGFLAAMGNDVTVMIRSIFLRGFDQQIANMIGDYMEKHGVKMVKECVPSAVKEINPPSVEENKPGLLSVEGKYSNGESFKGEYNTVVLAIGRDPCTSKLNLESLKIEKDRVGRLVCNDEEQTNVPNIYAIGDIVSGKLQLTPVAIDAGRNLARRLYSGSSYLTDYTNVATTVFTPLEYGAIGLAEEDAIKMYGEDDIEVYHAFHKPLEWTIAGREDNVCYCKLICVKSLDEKVVGFHNLGPNSGEVTQGFAVAMKLGATKADFDRTIGIHPTCAEVFTSMAISKSSGKDPKLSGC